MKEVTRYYNINLKSEIDQVCHSLSHLTNMGSLTYLDVLLLIYRVKRHELHTYPYIRYYNGRLTLFDIFNGLVFLDGQELYRAIVERTLNIRIADILREIDYIVGT